MSIPDRAALTEPDVTESGGSYGIDFPLRGHVSALPPVPPDCPEELVEKMSADILAKCERHWPSRQRELGACLVWTGAKGTDAETGPYGRIYDVAIGTCQPW